MRKMRKVHWSRRVLMGVLTLLMALAIAVTVDALSIVSHAQSQGRVTSESANIRETTSTSSTVVASVVRNDEITINGQTTGADGYTWYQVFVNADTLGYIRSDLVEIISGGTPPALSNTTTTTTNTNTNTTTTTPAATYNPTVEVTEVNPVSATVTGGREIRVRADASTSTSSGIITTAQNGTALTVTGQAIGTDNNVWYRVTFTVNGSEVTGFIRSDYVNLSEEVTPVTDTPEPEQTQEPEQTPEPVVTTKDYETQLQGEDWYLLDIAQAKQWKIAELFYAVDTNKELVEQDEATIKNLKIIIIILVVVILILAIALTMLIFKMKDMSDSAYFAEVEKETLRRGGSTRPRGSGQRTVRPQGAGGQRPAAQGSRPASDSRRPAQGGTRPAQGSRPAQASRTVQSPNAQRPSEGGARPAQSTQGSRPTQGESRPAQSAQRVAREDVRPASEQPREERKAQQKPASDNAQKQAWKSKNFMADEDEFEFEYLNWDGDEEP